MQIIGILLLVGFFVAASAWMARDAGWKNVGQAWLFLTGVVGTTALIAFSTSLITG